MIKKILVVLLIILIVIQFIKPQKNIHPGPRLQTFLHYTLFLQMLIRYWL